MVARLGVTGVLGAILGAWVLSNIDVTAARRFVYAYLLIIGFYILWRSMRIAAGTAKIGFLDASGGGGWGPMTTSTLVGSAHAPGHAVGSVNTAEIFVTVSRRPHSLRKLAPHPWDTLSPLVLGGVLAAPFGGWIVKRVPPRALMTAVGVLIVTLSIVQLFHAFRSI
jgi:uncharacterized protein